MPYHKQGAYDGFDSIAEAKKHYRKCRTLKHFILSNHCVANTVIACAACGKPLTVTEHNRCQWYPKTGLVAVMHYQCAWANLLNHIFKRESLI